MTDNLTPTNPVVLTHKFVFDINSISLEDLKKLYAHFRIEELDEVDKTTTKDEFFKCFIDEDTDGNKDAYLLIRLAAILASGSAKVMDCVYTSVDGSKHDTQDLFYNKYHELDFCDLDYYDFNADGFNIMFTIKDYGIEEAAPFLTKYNFLEPLN
jgi:hypothetical protein